ncbi:GGDEF domain-containing protein [Candidatus Margulisiibacteriota bacterium]
MRSQATRPTAVQSVSVVRPKIKLTKFQELCAGLNISEDRIDVETTKVLSKILRIEKGFEYITPETMEDLLNGVILIEKKAGWDDISYYCERKDGEDSLKIYELAVYKKLSDLMVEAGLGNNIKHQDIDRNNYIINMWLNSPKVNDALNRLEQISTDSYKHQIPWSDRILKLMEAPTDIVDQVITRVCSLDREEVVNRTQKLIDSMYQPYAKEDKNGAPIVAEILSSPINGKYDLREIFVRSFGLAATQKQMVQIYQEKDKNKAKEESIKFGELLEKGLLFLRAVAELDTATSAYNTRLKIQLHHQGLELVRAEQRIKEMEDAHTAEVIAGAREELARRNAEKAAGTDPLTGLMNRRKLEKEFNRERERAVRENLALSLVLIDADHFKGINDMYGHETGDLTLRKLSKIIKNNGDSNIRPYDIVGRWGGEEFVVVVVGSSEEGAHKAAERIRREVEAATIIDGHEVSISAGVVQWSGEEKIDQLVTKADRALYAAKGAGRNRTVKYLDLKSMDFQNPEIRIDDAFQDKLSPHKSSRNQNC